MSGPSHTVACQARILQLQLVLERLKAASGYYQVSAILKQASAELRADREVVLAAVAQRGRALEHADASLRVDREVVLAAVAQDGHALEQQRPTRCGAAVHRRGARVRQLPLIFPTHHPLGPWVPGNTAPSNRVWFDIEPECCGFHG
jgi:hypothetical protein